MKKFLLVATMALAALGVQAQGTLTFNNNASTAIRFDAANGGAQVPGGFVVGLYYSTDTALTNSQVDATLARAFGAGGAGNVEATTHGTALGQFFGLTKTFNPPLAGGTVVAVQVRAWSSGYATYEDALASGLQTVFAGKSNIFPLTLGGGPNPTPSITGTGKLLAFTVSPVPEPSTIALGLLGLGALALFRRRK
jgi:MYXO-CTERM domain-containing protein